MSQTIDLRIEHLSIISPYIIDPMGVTCNIKAQEPVKQSLVASATRALIINLR